MTEEERKIVEKFLFILKNLPNPQREYLLGYADGVAAIINTTISTPSAQFPVCKT